ncbi:condensation domain-containing protein [Streptococcus sp. S784/96/1]|uniref:condensation domain-containing protein n=1 Tax=Streptococcus sp. S784/96/1 TaxID=2653499 RepID=UPI001389B177|nr:condensation domain-containing protein [Streptococcus sp. S784/96/1]
MAENSYSYLDAPFTVREKWTGAVLDHEKGNSYYAGVKLKFSSNINLERAKLAIITVLSRVRILSSEMKIIDDKLVMCLPSESYIKNRLLCELPLSEEETDQDFVTPSLSPFLNGLKLKYRWDGKNHCFLIGFWTFTCDGLSIDLIIKAIVDYYENEEIPILYDKNSLLNIEKRSKYSNFVIESEYFEKASLNNCFTSIKNDLESRKSKTITIDFEILEDELSVVARRLGVTDFTIIFSLFQNSISEICELPTVITGVPFVNRYSLTELNTVGPFANTIPVLTSYPEKTKFIDKIFITQEALLDSSQRQMLDYSKYLPKGHKKLYNQIFNSWNAKLENKTINLSDGNCLSVELIHNGTVRSELDITIGTSSSGNILGKFGFYCKNSEIVNFLIESMKQKFKILKEE